MCLRTLVDTLVETNKCQNETLEILMKITFARGNIRGAAAARTTSKEPPPAQGTQSPPKYDMGKKFSHETTKCPY